MALVMFDYKSNPSKYVYMSPVFGTNKCMLFRNGKTQTNSEGLIFAKISLN